MVSFRVEDPEGLINLVDADGNKYNLAGKPAYSSCAVAEHPSNKTKFCDGTHSKIGFQAAEAAVKAEEQQQNQQKPNS